MAFLQTSFQKFNAGLNGLLSTLSSEFVPFWGCLTTGPGFSVSKCFYEHDALVGVSWLCVAIIVYSFVFSIVGQNCSKVDQIWSVTPWVFGWLFYAHRAAHAPHPRLLLVCILMTLWGTRLTFNFWRRGGYGNGWTHEEDYRWPVLRKIIGNWFLFLLFNITFIASYQNILLLLIALPAYGVMKSPITAISVSDWVLAAVFVLLLVMETVADQQHYDFQEYKHSLKEAERKRHTNPDIRDGFLRAGLFKYSRHPNYFAEQAQWVVIFLFTVASAEDFFNVYSMGAILLVLLFQGSVAFSEGLTAKKYPKYAEYQKSVSQMIPFFPASPAGSAPAAARGKRSSSRKGN